MGQVRETDVAFERWKQEVRDPASRNSEGIRVLRCGKAELQYEIAPLPCGRVALSWDFRLYFGPFTGQCAPWTPSPDRQTALNHLLPKARQWFSDNEPNDKSCRDMVNALSGLFFVEPEVTENS